MNIDPRFDLVINKVLDISPQQAWSGWMNTDLYGEWFCPKPWTVADAKIDPRPGGEFYTLMQSPDGDKFPSIGCILEAIPFKKLVWTSSLLPEYRPAPHQDLALTVELFFEAFGEQTKYTAIAHHATEEDRIRHEQMGFEQGWGICADQLVALMKSLK